MHHPVLCGWRGRLHLQLRENPPGGGAGAVAEQSLHVSRDHLDCSWGPGPDALPAWLALESAGD